MHSAILAIWGTGLAGAVVATAFILRVSRLVVESLHDLLALSRAIARSAHGIDAHATALRTLPDLRAAARQFAEAASAAERSLDSICPRLERLPRGR
jgi:hypothetical protein